MYDPFDESSVLKSSWFKFGKPGDNIYGTLIRVFKTTSNFPDKKDEENISYEVKVDGGEFHNIDSKKNPIDPPVALNAGDIWSFTGGFMVDNALRNVKLGQKIAVKFSEEKASKQKGFNDMKIKKVYAPKNPDGTVMMDQEWLDSNTQLTPLNAPQ